MTSLRVTTDIDTSGIAILAVAGPLVADAGDRLTAVVSATLQERGPTRLVVDLARVGVADEAAIQALLRCRADALRAGVTFRVIRPQHPVRHILHRHGACHLLTWEYAPDRPPRLASVSDGRRAAADALPTHRLAQRVSNASPLTPAPATTRWVTRLDGLEATAKRVEFERGVR